MNTLLVPVQPPLDERWYHEILAFDRPGELYAYLMPDAEELAIMHDRFIRSGFSEIPQLTPPQRHQAAFEEDLAGLATLRQQIYDSETNEHVQALYLGRIDELDANCRLWLAAFTRDYAGFKAANRYLYGEPDSGLFVATCRYLHDLAQDALHNSSVVVADAAAHLLSLLPTVTAGRNNRAALFPGNAAYQAAMALHTRPGGYFAQLFGVKGLPRTGTIDRQQGDLIVAHILRSLEAGYGIADTPDEFWGVRHSTHDVLRPADYTLDVASFKGIVAHEIGSHLLERVNGLRGPLRLLASGLERYEHGNEGRALMREQLALGRRERIPAHYSWKFGVIKHFGISLGAGLNGRPATFVEVYTLIDAVYRLWKALEMPHADPHDIHQAAANQSWLVTTRILKGTSGYGDAYRKDSIYLEGNMRAWRIAAHNPALLLLGDIGKFDIGNRQQITSLQAIGALPRAI